MDDDLFLLSDIASINEIQGQEHETNVYPRSDPMNDWGEEAFRIRYRMRKDSVFELLQLIEHKLPEPKATGRKRIPAIERLLIALRYYAEGCIQRSSGDVHGYSQPTVSRTITEISAAIASLANDFIVFPDEKEGERIAAGFYDMIKKRYPRSRPLPQIIGAIDGTLIPILAHGVPNRELFRDRHTNISLNVQAICDHELIFTNVVARWQGSVHDSRMFNNCELFGRFERGEIRGWLVGDSGYPLKPDLLIPYLRPQTPGEQRYNFAQIQSRNVIERAFGLLKNRFGVIGKNGGWVRCNIETALDVVTSCFVLHNFLRKRKDLFEPDPPIREVIPKPIAENVEDANRNNKHDVRSNLISLYFDK
jgi:hypothetical protein